MITGILTFSQITNPKLWRVLMHRHNCSGEVKAYVHFNIFFVCIHAHHCHPQLGWLLTFLKMYIRVFQQGSDLDDTVEEKLLIGDRPKQSPGPDRWPSLRARLVQRNEEELSEVKNRARSNVVY
jgi:hypothetical protein